MPSNNQEISSVVTGINKNFYQAAKAGEKMSSGIRVNRAGDDPAALVQSEILRIQAGGMEQAIKNADVDLSMLRTADDALGSVSELLSYLKQIALHAANSALSDQISRETDQAEAQEILLSLERFANQTQFGNRKLLDGSSGATGVAMGKFLEFISANEKTRSSPNTGYSVEITQRATQSYLLGTKNLTAEDIPGLVLKVESGGKSAEYYAKKEDTPESVAAGLQAALDSVNLPITVDKNPSGNFLLYHNTFGSKATFNASSNVAGIITTQADVWEKAEPGKDVIGKVNKIETIGEGQFLKSAPGDDAEGLVVRYTYDQENLDDPEPLEENAGSVLVKQNSVYFQNSDVEKGGFWFSFENIHPTNLGKSSDEYDQIKNLKNINLNTEALANASISVIDSATQQVLGFRSRLGAVQKNAVEASLNYLRIARENIVAAESTIRDADVAEEISNVLRSQIQVRSSAWLLHNSTRLKSELESMLMKGVENAK